MSFGDNESYSIEVELTSVGEIPAYLQHHKNVRVSNSSSNINNSSDKFAMEEIEDDADEDNEDNTDGKNNKTATKKYSQFNRWSECIETR